MKSLFIFTLYLFFISLIASTMIYGNHTIIIQNASWAGWSIYNSNQPNSYTINSINGSWIVEKVLPSNELGWGMQWIGIGGLGNSDLLQIGTVSNWDCELVLSKPMCYPKYRAFWETTNNAIITSEQPISISVHPEDKIYASINSISSTHCLLGAPCWELYLKDLNGSQISTYYVTYTPNRTSANWEEESIGPLSGSTYPFPLSKFWAADFGPKYTDMPNTNYANVNITTNKPVGWYSNLVETYISRNFAGTAHPSNVTISSDNSSFIVYEGPQLEMVGGLNVSRSMLDLGQEAAINGPHAEGGSGNYTYQWIGSCVAGAWGFYYLSMYNMLYFNT